MKQKSILSYLGPGPIFSMQFPDEVNGTAYKLWHFLGLSALEAGSCLPWTLSFGLRLHLGPTTVMAVDRFKCKLEDKNSDFPNAEDRIGFAFPFFPGVHLLLL